MPWIKATPTILDTLEVDWPMSVGDMVEVRSGVRTRIFVKHERGWLAIPKSEVYEVVDENGEVLNSVEVKR